MQIHSSSTPYRSLIGPGKAETGFSPEEEKPQETGEAESAQGDLQSPANLDEEQLRQVEKLKQRDREVHTHEMAHLAAAGPYAQGGPSFEYQKGPDGQRYAVGGHVNIDTSPVPGDPEATLRKAETVRRAAMAPGNPSPQDRSVAAAAAAMAIQARIEIQQSQGKQTSPVESALHSSPKSGPTGAFAAVSYRNYQQESPPPVIDFYG